MKHEKNKIEKQNDIQDGCFTCQNHNYFRNKNKKKKVVRNEIETEISFLVNFICRKTTKITNNIVIEMINKIK